MTTAPIVTTFDGALGTLDRRQQCEVAFALLYRDHFKHGTTGHNQLLLIAELAEMVRRLEARDAGIQAMCNGKEISQT